MSQSDGIPDADTAYQNVFQGAYGRVFLDTLASRGYGAATEKDAMDLFALGNQVAAATEAAAVKKASDGGRFAGAVQDLGRVLGNAGLPDPVKQAAAGDMDRAALHVGAALAEDPVLYNSILALKVAEAREGAARFGVQV